ncbi:recombinase family protein [Acuticoccus sp. MNP-M23]|uniref:recombinase family protein n=1 Tax=Acuticoccus sp. MNP-M23 TaxID=3072793 RepID=UPI00281641CE|nr:recombinase family protein [Acuticoccus sp. MNP-M23]WMS44993.1 recombinase family protein [Acuticoccus sp. MNP-M23]
METVEGLETEGIGFRSLTEAIDKITSGGKLVFHIFGALAEFERAINRERIRAGLDAAKALGRTGGLPKKLTDADLKAAMAMLSAEDFTVDEVAKRMGGSPATLYRYLPAPRATITRNEPT